MATLPGVNTIIKDGMRTISRTEIPVGPRVLAIGRRTTTETERVDGKLHATLTPYPARREDEVIRHFGEGSDLHRAYLELVAGGAQTVYLTALPSDTEFNHAAGTIDSDGLDDDIDLFDVAFSTAEAIQADIVIPWGRGSNANDWDEAATPGNDDEIGFHADNSGTLANSWVTKISDKMAEITTNSHPAFAVLGVAPQVGPLQVSTTDLSTHLTFPTLADRDAVVNGVYVSVVATELRPVGYPVEFGYSNGAALYAGHLAQLDSWSSPTGKLVYNIANDGLRYNPSRTQQAALIDKGLVPVATDFSNRPVWVDALTFSTATSDFTRITTLRIVFDAVQLVRQIAQRFVGEASTLQARNSFDTAVRSGLRGMQQVGALLASDFDISYIPTENKAIVDLVLTPAFELRNIEISVAVQL